MSKNKTAKKESNKIFYYDGKKYFIDSSKKVDCTADYYEKGRVIYIDNHVPKKFFEGVSVHEIEERKLIRKGHSYGWSHNEAQKLELNFYAKKFGAKKAEQMMKEEERVAYDIYSKYLEEDLKIIDNITFMEYNSDLYDYENSRSKPASLEKAKAPIEKIKLPGNPST